jgi:hypothetical protein
MIIKVLPRKSLSSPRNLIRYILNDDDRIRDEKNGGFVLKHNLNGDNIKEWENAYLINESKRVFKRRSNNVVNHVILAMGAKDATKITPEILKDLTQKYIEFRGNQGMYLASPHWNREHLHVHICESGLEYESGMSMRMAKTEFARLKQSLERYQREQYPFLEHSSVNHGKGLENEISDREVQLNIRKGKLSRKQILKNILSETLPNSTNLNELKTTLESQGIKIYQRGGKNYGIEFEGRNHRFDNLGFAEQIIELERREELYHERFNELEDIAQIKEGKEIKMKGYIDKDLEEFDMVAEGLLEYDVSEKEVGNAEEQPASDKLTPTD